MKTFIERLLKRKEEKATDLGLEKGGCEHDWYTVAVDETMGVYRGFEGKNVYSAWEQNSNISELHDYVYSPFSGPAMNRVCLICGECKNEIKEAQEIINRNKLAEIEREKLAKKLWAECEGGK